MSKIFKHRVNWRYALGEIVLIFLGISLAIAFNNWNENRKSTNQGREYIRQIYKDLQQDQSRLLHITNQLQGQRTSGIKVLRYIEDHQLGIQTPLDSFWKDFQLLPWSVIPDRTENEYDGLKTSGEVGLLKDDSLEFLLSDFYSNFDMRISNFNDLPLTVRSNLRRVQMRLFDSETIEYPDWKDRVANEKRREQSKHYMESAMDDDQVYALTKEIVVTSHRNLEWFIPLSRKAGRILSYLEDNHKNVIK